MTASNRLLLSSIFLIAGLSGNLGHAAAEKKTAGAETLAEISEREMTTLATQKNCMACHAVERKLVGPSFTEVAKKYASKPDAAEMLAKKIRQGGAGVWGPVPMPANLQVTEAEALSLAKWTLTH